MAKPLSELTRGANPFADLLKSRCHTEGASSSTTKLLCSGSGAVSGLFSRLRESRTGELLPSETRMVAVEATRRGREVRLAFEMAISANPFMFGPCILTKE